MSMEKFKPGEVVFICSEYYDGDQDAMWKDISTFIRVLFKNNYIFKLYPDSGDSDIIVVQFHEGDPEISEAVLRWTTWEEIEKFTNLYEVNNEEKS